MMFRPFRAVTKNLRYSRVRSPQKLSHFCGCFDEPYDSLILPPSTKQRKTCRSKSFLSGGRGRIRTIEAKRSRFTVCPLWPLGNSPILNWSWWTDSNPRPADYKSAALPTELHQHFQAPK